ncbi:MAG: hypothetical protein DHS20C13_29580 [Thermodesulfobacteriota bacterium]|nr:MAG: hypothetical protein DHS20C13_29580 [Thermodesulfobacteriota bacterium]
MRDINEYEDEDYDNEDWEEDEYVEEEESGLQTGFTQVPNSILTDTNLSVQARLLYSNLLSFAWDKDFCNPSQIRLGKNMGRDPRTIRLILKELEEQEYLDIYRYGYNNPSIYHLHVFPPQKKFKYLFNDTLLKKSIAKARKKAKKRSTQEEKKIRTKRK